MSWPANGMGARPMEPNQTEISRSRMYEQALYRHLVENRPEQIRTLREAGRLETYLIETGARMSRERERQFRTLASRATNPSPGERTYLWMEADRIVRELYLP